MHRAARGQQPEGSSSGLAPQRLAVLGHAQAPLLLLQSTLSCAPAVGPAGPELKVLGTCTVPGSPPIHIPTQGHTLQAPHVHSTHSSTPPRPWGAPHHPHAPTWHRHHPRVNPHHRCHRTQGPQAQCWGAPGAACPVLPLCLQTGCTGNQSEQGGTPEGLSWEVESCGTMERFPPDLRFPSYRSAALPSSPPQREPFPVPNSAFRKQKQMHLV